ncbi:MAG: hypothetical protein M3P98_00110 [bacterium]|nr:hypothetical protein [bacterium]
MKIQQIIAQIPDTDVNIPRVTGDQALIESVLQIVFATTTIIAVLIITIAGITYVLSGGNPETTSRAKDAILYAIIGLVISLLALTIVAFVLGRVG